MSRRDTILVAVLINAGLLAVLFATAVNRDPHTIHQNLSTTTEQPSAQEQVIHTASAPITPVKDEGDQALARYRERVQQRKTEPVKPVVVNKATEVTKVAPTATKPETATVAATATAVEEPVEKGFVEVTVKRGDALSRIARANGTTVEAIMEANSLSGTNLRIGQVLRVPVNDAPRQPATREIASADIGDDYYIVQRGDSPWSIARKHGLQLEELKELNDLDEAKARHLKPGDKLRLK